LQCPIYKHLSPAWGQRVGGVSGRPAQETKRSDPLPCLLPRRWKAPWSTGSVASFAGCRKSAGLGRFVLTCVTGLFPHVRRTDDKRVSSGRTRRGTSSAYAKRTHSTPEGAPATRPPQHEDTSFARSRDPCTSNATELGPVKSRKGWRGRFGIAVGQTWATRKNRHRDWANTDELRGLPSVTALARGNA
jgi:hypothetical protein